MEPAETEHQLLVLGGLLATVELLLRAHVVQPREVLPEPRGRLRGHLQPALQNGDGELSSSEGKEGGGRSVLVFSRFSDKQVHLVGSV